MAGSSMPKLSICVPSRNRQIYFQQTILSLIASCRPDVEFIFVDNSDDASIMVQFMAQLAGDPRIKFLPAASPFLSMVDHWERAVAASSGDWVMVIGDGDYADPDIAAILLKIELFIPDAEAFSWAASDFAWPQEGEPQASNSVVHLEPHFIDMPRDWLFARTFLWVDTTDVPVHGFSICHSALSRPLLERNRARFGGRYFQHPAVDFESSFKAVLMGTRFIYWERPLSIQGTCPKDTIDDEKSVKGVPFNSDMGLPARALVTQQRIKSEFGLELDGWQENFVKACQTYCESMPSLDRFDVIVDQYRKAFGAWENGRYAALFNPVYSGLAENFGSSSGLKGKRLFINNRLSGAQTPKDAYDLMTAILSPLDETLIDPLMLRRPKEDMVSPMERD